ncbi:MAG: hypothetical protein QNJ64_12045 [Crocosphaera sp.]|nr:hypothetical protein [Crocosphaera sp.]
MSPLPQIRTLKKKPTDPSETNKPSVDTEVDTSETIEPAPTKTKTKQTLAGAPSTTSTATTTEQLKEETANSKNDLNGQTAITTVTEYAVGTTESQSDTRTDDQSTDEPETDIDKPIFQAIGTMQGKAQKDDEGNFFLRLGGKRYNIFFAGYRYQAWLKQAEAHPEQTLFFRVYPKCLMIPRKPPRIYFQVAAWEAENPWEEQPGQFRLKGIWQFVPQVRTPVISIYRNHNASDPKGKFKATHIPVLMRRDDESAPFRFNPKIAKEDLPPRWFVQGKFKFIPSRDSFGFSEDLEPPTKKIPYYKKPIKDVQSKDSVKGAQNKSDKPSRKKVEKPQKKALEKTTELSP